MDKKFMITNNEELIYYLSNYGEITADRYEQYDHGWAVTMFLACLDNIKNYSLPVEIEDFGDYLDEEQIEFIFKIADSLKKYKEENLNNTKFNIYTMHRR